MKLNRTLIRGCIALVASGALLLTGMGVASASGSETIKVSSISTAHSIALPLEIPSSSISSCATSDAEALKFANVSAERTKKLIERTQNLLESSQIKVFSKTSSLAFDRAITYALTTSKGIHHSVTIPITGTVSISNFTVIYGPDERVSNYAETKVEKSGEGFINIAQWVNGNQSLDKKVYIGDLDFDDLGSQSTYSIPMNRSWQKAVSCLAAVLGVSTSVAAVILSLCGGSCAAPEPTFSKGICAACIGGMVTLGGTSIKGVVKCFGYW